MKAIRGATTVKCDSPAEIKTAVFELLREICAKNGISEDDIEFILFSNTDDLRSYYPAKAAREAGFSVCSLFSAAEPQIDGSLKRCIRVMVVCDELKTAPKHVYLNEAINLRRDLTKKFNVAIDGPAGSGKSTVSKIIAKKLGVLCLDTGAMYRACALACIKNGINISDEKQVEGAIAAAEIAVKYSDGRQTTVLNGDDVSEVIRTPDISMAASTVSKYAFVRGKMVDLQRKIAKEQSCVLDGRDIGTNVLPDAEFKFYLTASPAVRAERRMKENKLKGINQPYDVILKDISLRDEQDKTREIAPLKKAADAIEIDTSDLNIEEVCDLIIKKIQEKI